jgi:hypothetical protein
MCAAAGAFLLTMNRRKSKTAPLKPKGAAPGGLSASVAHLAGIFIFTNELKHPNVALYSPTTKA